MGVDCEDLGVADGAVGGACLPVVVEDGVAFESVYGGVEMSDVMLTGEVEK